MLIFQIKYGILIEDYIRQTVKHSLFSLHLNMQIMLHVDIFNNTFVIEI